MNSDVERKRPTTQTLVTALVQSPSIISNGKLSSLSRCSRHSVNITVTLIRITDFFAVNFINGSAMLAN
jgi:hypothetical protein